MRSFELASRSNMQPVGQEVFRVLFLCTGNSARSQMAEAVLNYRGRGCFAAEALREAGIQWSGHPPRGLERLEREPWDIVITVCDNAREACPIFPGHPLVVHWSMNDPAAAEGAEEDKRKAFADALRVITGRVDLLLDIPIVTLERRVVRDRLQSISRFGETAGDGGHI